MKKNQAEPSSNNLIEKQTRELQASDARFRLLLDHLIDGIMIVAQDNTIRFVNPAAEKMFQRSAQELVGSRLNFPLSGRITTEIDLPGPNCSTIPIEIRVVEIEWETQRAYLANLRDLTEGKRSEEERRQVGTQIQFAQKLESLRILAGGIAHDFNNILMTIVARAGLARRALGSESPIHEHLTQIEKAGLRGGELANQMLTYAGRGKAVVQKLNISKLIKEMTHLLGASISKHAVLHYEMAKKPLLIYADPEKFQQVVMTLITNASEAIGERHGIITLGTGSVKLHQENSPHWHIAGDLPTNPAVYLEVRDTGCGMTEAILPKIFDPFFTTKFIGRGLGLAALLGIVRAQGGAVAVSSQLGHGTQVRVFFPSVLPKVQVTTTPDLKWQGSGTILVVDDEEDIRIASQLILRDMGFRVLTAQNGRVGLTEFQKHIKDITLILLDLTMPIMNGRELFKEIRQLNKDIPVILSSGYSEGEALKRFADKGINGFIQKPYQLEALVEKVRQVVERRH